jgi:hypothetical protein
VTQVRRDIVVLVASLTVFAGCAVVAADGRVGPIERAAFHAVNGLPEGLYGPMLAFQYLGVLATCRWSWPSGRWRCGAGGWPPRWC